MGKFIITTCIASILFASPAFAYKREAPPKGETEESEPQQVTREEYDYSYGRSGLVTAGYVFIALGGAAAIAGSTIAVATDKRLAGTIVGATGAALGLTGSFMILFGGQSGYALAPTIDPVHKTYGLTLAKNF